VRAVWDLSLSLRETFQVLASEGLLELLPNRGAAVSAPTLKDALDHLVLERSLEALAIGLACEHASACRTVARRGTA